MREGGGKGGSEEEREGGRNIHALFKKLNPITEL